MRTCGECKWWRPCPGGIEPPGPACIAFHGWHGPLKSEEACPAFDDGSRDKAVEELIKTWVESSAIIRERCPYEWAFITRAIAAVQKARGK